MKALIAACATAVLVACAPAVPPSGPSTEVTVAAQPVTARQVVLDVRQARVGGGRIAWAELGTGDPLVLLNGTASPMSEWDPSLLAELATGHRVIVMDYPGLGGSSALTGRLTFDRLADVVDEWLTAIGVERPAVLGWSMGTFVTQRLAVRHPDRADRILLVAGNPGGGRTTLGPRWVQRADSDPEYTTRTYLRTNYPHTSCARAAGRGFLERQAAAVASGRYPPDRVPTRTYNAMVAAEDPWLRSDRNLRQLRRLTVPTAVIVGQRDVITPPANSRVLAEQIPGAELTEVTGAGHSVLFQEPAAFADLVGRFLDGVTAPGRRNTVMGVCG